ncbi:MAG: anion permease, partial [Candidatus Latescibacteria bacterium]|nr:anion permease [Candidatus Latescibacterota bacterium]
MTALEQRFDRWRRSIGLIIGPLIFLLLLVWPAPTLSVHAHRLSAILGLVIVYWVSEALPLPIAALLGVVLCVLLGVAEATEALS